MDLIFPSFLYFPKKNFQIKMYHIYNKKKIINMLLSVLWQLTFKTSALENQVYIYIYFFR